MHSAFEYATFVQDWTDKNLDKMREDQTDQIIDEMSKSEVEEYEKGEPYPYLEDDQ